MPTKIQEVLVTGIVGPRPFPIGFVALLVIGGLIVAGLCVGGSVISTQHEVATQDAIEQKILKLRQNPPINIRMWKGKCLSTEYSDCPWGNNQTYLFVEVVNNWDGQIALVNSDPELYCNRDILWHHFAPGEMFSFACVSASDDNIDVLDQACLNLMFEVDSYDPMYSREPKPKICKKL